MKRTIFKISLLIIYCLTGSAFADQAHNLFEKANQSYHDGDYSAAIKGYENILSGGMESGELYYNLANAYYKLNKLGNARLNYERALIWMENDEAVLQNLSLLKLRLVDQIEEPPRLFISKWWESLLSTFSLPTLGNIVLFLFWTLLISIAIFLHYQKRGRIKFKSLFNTVLVIWLFALVIWANKIYLFESEIHGVILLSTVTVQAEPSDNTTELFVIHEGTKVKINRSSGDWFEIQLIDGKTGWLKNNALEKI